MDTDHARQSPLNTRIATLLASYAVLITGNGLLGTLVSLRLVPPDFSAVAAGWVQSAYYLGFVFGAVLSGRFILAVGHHRAFAVFAWVVACASLGHVLSSSVPGWFVLRALAGFCLAGIFSVVESLLHASADNRVRGRVFSLYMMTNYLGVACGQLLLNLASPSGWILFALVASLFSASVLPMLFSADRMQTSGQAGVRPPAGFRSIFDALALVPLGAAGCVLSGVLNSSFYSLMPAYLERVGFSVAALSSTLFFALLMALAFQWPSGFLSDRFDRRKVLIGTGLVNGALCLALLMQPEGQLLRWLVALFAGTAFTVYPLSVALINDRVPTALRVPASAAVLMGFSLGGSLGPVLASAAIGWLGPQGLFAFCAVASGVFSLVGLRILLVRGRAA